MFLLSLFGPWQTVAQFAHVRAFVFSVQGGQPKNGRFQQWIRREPLVLNTPPNVIVRKSTLNSNPPEQNSLRGFQIKNPEEAPEENPQNLIWGSFFLFFVFYPTN